MKPLTEQFRPHKLAEVVGQPVAVKALQGKLRMKTSFAAILAGDPGTGKTSAAYAIAAELGADVDGSEAQRATSGFLIVPSNGQGVERLDEIFEHCRYRPWTGSLWWTILFEEADCQSRQAVSYLKTRLELLPRQTIVLFTTNSKIDDFACDAIQERCLCLKFESRAEKLWDDAQELVNRAWETSLGRNHAPSLEELGFAKTGRLSFRQVLSRLEPLILAELPPEPEAVTVEPAGEPAITKPGVRNCSLAQPEPELPPKPISETAALPPKPAPWHPKLGEIVQLPTGETGTVVERGAYGSWRVGRRFFATSQFKPVEVEELVNV